MYYELLITIQLLYACGQHVYMQTFPMQACNPFILFRVTCILIFICYVHVTLHGTLHGTLRGTLHGTLLGTLHVTCMVHCMVHS